MNIEEIKKRGVLGAISDEARTVTRRAQDSFSSLPTNLGNAEWFDGEIARIKEHLEQLQKLHAAFIQENK